MQKDRHGRLQGPRALVIAGGQAAVLDWPLTPRTTLRDPVIDARWIQPGYKAPAWGKDPPAVAPEIAGSLPKSKEDPRGTEKEKKPVEKVKPSPNMVPMPGITPPRNVGAEKPDPDPFGDLVSGVLADAFLPGASVIIDIANTVGDAAAPTATGTTPPTPGIQEPDEPEHSEPEAGD